MCVYKTLKTVCIILLGIEARYTWVAGTYTVGNKIDDVQAAMQNQR